MHTSYVYVSHKYIITITKVSSFVAVKDSSEMSKYRSKKRCEASPESESIDWQTSSMFTRDIRSQFSNEIPCLPLVKPRDWLLAASSRASFHRHLRRKKTVCFDRSDYHTMTIIRPSCDVICFSLIFLRGNDGHFSRRLLTAVHVHQITKTRHAK